MVKNGYNPDFLFMTSMEPFDEQILTALINSKPKGFTELMGVVGFSHNTLQQHLSRLVTRDIVAGKSLIHVTSRSTKRDSSS